MTLTAGLKAALVSMLRESTQPLTTVELMCLHHGLIAVDQHVVLTTVGASLYFRDQKEQQALYVLDQLRTEVEATHTTYQQIQEQKKQGRLARATALADRALPKLPPRHVVTPASRKLIRSASYSGLAAYQPAHDSMIRTALDTIRQAMPTHHAMLRTAVQTALDLSQSQYSGFGLAAQLAALSSTTKWRELTDPAGIMASLPQYTPAEYEEVPETVEQHPYWVAIERLEHLAEKIPLFIWQKAPTERMFRGHDDQHPSPVEAAKWFANQNRAFRRALNDLEKEGAIQGKGERKRRRYTLASVNTNNASQ